MTIKNAYMLDTNIIIIWARGGYGADVLEEMYALDSEKYPFMASIVSFAEALVIAKQNKWGDGKMKRLKSLFGRVDRIDVVDDIVPAYCEIQAFRRSKRSSRHNIGQNDLWIAATARALRATLITTDKKDFEPLADQMIYADILEPETFKKP